MSRTKKLAAVSAATIAAALAVAVQTAPAQAEAAGPISATLSGNMTINAGINWTCTSSTMGGTIADDGTLSITSATVGGCGVTVAPANLPWSGSLSGGVATLSGFQVTAVGCTYGGSLTGSYVDGPLPVTATFTNQSVPKVSGIFCPGSVSLTASYVFSQP
ncbi:hypothetical protein [Actinomadura sp. 6N118]|uniref:hypothetical protein n=1 Tax=Actinomadura sp. 6N118 TaxID=3375151 RepID=UPI00379AC637